MNDDEPWTHTHTRRREKRKQKKIRSFICWTPITFIPPSRCPDCCFFFMLLDRQEWRCADSNGPKLTPGREQLLSELFSSLYKNRPIVDESSSTSTYVTAGTCVSVCCYSRRNRCDPFPLSPPVRSQIEGPPSKLMSTDVVDTRACIVSGYVGASFLFPSTCIRPTAWKFDDYTPHIHTYTCTHTTVGIMWTLYWPSKRSPANN
jgi:hypothetical protein